MNSLIVRREDFSEYPSLFESAYMYSPARQKSYLAESFGVGVTPNKYLEPKKKIKQ